MSELPSGWVKTTLGEISIYIQRGKSPKYIEKSEFPVVNQKAVRWEGIIEEYLKYVHPDQWEKWNDERYIKVNDILWNSTGTGTIGRACFIDKEEVVKAKVVDSHVTIVRVSPYIHPKFLFYYIKGPSVQDKIDQLYTGTTNQVELSKTAITSIQIPLPPLNEQKRIVEKLDRLFANLDSLKTRLAHIPELLKQFRQSVLTQAVTGKLTEEWREGKSLPDVEEIVEELQEKRINKAKGKEKDKLKAIYIDDEDEPFEIPKAWAFYHLDKLAESFSYGTSAKSQNEGKIPVLRMGNIQNGEIDWTDLKYSNDDKEIAKYSLEVGDVIFNRTNSPELVGKTAIYKGRRPCIYAGYLIKIKSFEVLNSDYLNYALNSPYARSWSWNVKSDGVSQSNINAQKLSKFVVPFPSLVEQNEIVRRVKALFSIADKMEERYEKLKAQIEHLPQAILAKAFRGELVPQDPNDESAEVLLERIQAEREGKADKSASKKNGQQVAKASATQNGHAHKMEQEIGEQMRLDI